MAFLRSGAPPWRSGATSHHCLLKACKTLPESGQSQQETVVAAPTALPLLSHQATAHQATATDRYQ